MLGERDAGANMLLLRRHAPRTTPPGLPWGRGGGQSSSVAPEADLGVVREEGPEIGGSL